MFLARTFLRHIEIGCVSVEKAFQDDGEKCRNSPFLSHACKETACAGLTDQNMIDRISVYSRFFLDFVDFYSVHKYKDFVEFIDFVFLGNL